MHRDRKEKLRCATFDPRVALSYVASHRHTLPCPMTRTVVSDHIYNIYKSTTGLSVPCGKLS